ncbi:hypothetical protein niasHT_026907 [Heterodera trifolii]|uniref:Uncharacterized protein n=1 Tax=Heterodera trifolii TaxID=157864 RepID=A0ABD2JY03_9BILA
MFVGQSVGMDRRKGTPKVSRKTSASSSSSGSSAMSYSPASTSTTAQGQPAADQQYQQPLPNPQEYHQAQQYAADQQPYQMQLQYPQEYHQPQQHAADQSAADQHSYQYQPYQMPPQYPQPQIPYNYYQFQPHNQQHYHNPHLLQQPNVQSFHLNFPTTPNFSAEHSRKLISQFGTDQRRDLPLLQNSSSAGIRKSSKLHLNSVQAKDNKNQSQKKADKKRPNQKEKEKLAQNEAENSSQRQIQKSHSQNLSKNLPNILNEENQKQNLMKKQQNTLINLKQTQKEKRPINSAGQQNESENLSALSQNFAISMQNVEFGSSSNNPIIFFDDESEGTVENWQMKRPMESSELLEETEKQKKKRDGKRTSEEAEEEEKQRQNIRRLLGIKKAFLNEIWKIVTVSFAMLGIEVEPIEQQTNEGKWPQFELALRQIGALLVLDKEQLKTSWNFCDKTITAINSEAQTFLGSKIFKTMEVGGSDQSGKFIGLIDTNGDKKLKILFFFVRLIRKLAGELETPYESYRQKDTIIDTASTRKWMLSWLSTVLAQLSHEFYATVGALRIDRKEMEKRMRFLEQSDLARGVLCLAKFATRQTLAALSGNNLEAEKLLEFNILCPIIINGQQQQQKVDFDKMVEKCIYSPENYGVASVFADLVRKAIVQNGNKNDTIFQSAKIYSGLYTAILKMQKEVNLEEWQKVPMPFATEWNKMKKFLSESAEEIDTFVKRWEEMGKNEKETKIGEKVKKEGFFSDNLLEKCIPFIVENNKKGNRTNN